MRINYLDDDDLAFLPECSEAHLEAFTRILTHGENGKPRLSSTLLRTKPFCLWRATRSAIAATGS